MTSVTDPAAYLPATAGGTSGALEPVRDVPRFSVVVPAVDEEAVIGDCLSSLLAQSFPGWVEIIVVDNASTDGTAEQAGRYGVRVVSEPRAGVCFARQRGLAAAHGEIVVSTDADTTFAPTWLAMIDEQFAADPGAVAVAGPCAYADGPWWSQVWQRVLFSSVAAVARTTHKVGYVTATNLAFRRDAFDAYDTRLTQGGDELDVLRRLQKRGRVVFVADNPTFTSARRLRRGLVYTVVVSLGYYYLFGYLLNRVTGRRVLGSAPPVRTHALAGRPPSTPLRLASGASGRSGVGDGSWAQEAG